MLGKLIDISGLEYFREQDKQSRAENLQYYTDNETIDRGHSEFGRWFVVAEEGAKPLSDNIVHGEIVDWKTIEALANGLDPATGKPFEGQTENKQKARVAARDIVFSAPKPVSVLHAAGRIGAHQGGNQSALYQAIADITRESHEAGVEAGMKYLQDVGAFQVRFGKNGSQRERAQWMAGAMFTHYTSRKGDIQLHSHVPMPNVARRPDGSVGAWDNYAVNNHRHAASAVYRAEMISLIKQRMKDELGIEVHASKDGRNFKIDGIPDQVNQHFSKRRQQILKKIYEDYKTTDTAHNRTRAQFASWETRDDKSGLPPIQELYARWDFELNALGYSIGSLIENVHMTARKAEQIKDEAWAKVRAEAAENGVELPEQRPDRDLQEIAKKAVGGITDMQSTFQRRFFEVNLLEHLQTSCDAKTAVALVAQVKAENEYVQVGFLGRAKEPVFTDAKTLIREYALLDIESRMRNNVRPVDPAKVDAAIRGGIAKDDGSGERFYLRAEQERAVRHLLSSSQLSDVVGDAGTGKTTMMIIARVALEADGFTVHVAAPTNKAVSGLLREVGLPLDRGYSVTRLLMEVENGKLQLGPTDYVMLDEAGMIDSEAWLKLNQVAEATGCRFGRIGDPKQKQAVQAGAPMRSVTEAYGCARLMEIARQNDAWARQASKDAASSNAKDSVMAYADRGFVIPMNGAEATDKAAAAKFMELNAINPGEVIWIAATNAEVRRGNQIITELKAEAGLLKGPAREVEGIARGSDDNTSSFIVMEGSRLILGETVKWQGERFDNNAMGSVEKIADDEGFEPDITIRWDDGRRTKFKWSQFVGFREDDDKLKDVPKLALADVMTDYAAQGVTVKHCVETFNAPSNLQSWYVGSTRHKVSFHAFYDADRIESDLAQKKGKVFTMGKDGSSSQEDDEPTAEITPEAILEKFIEEVSVTASKANACDFLGGAKKFLQEHRADYEAGFSLRQDLTQPQSQKEAAKADAVQTADMNREGTMKKPEEANNQEQKATESKAEWRKSRVRGLGMTGGQLAAQKAAKAEAETAAMIDRRLNAPAKPETTLKSATKTPARTDARAPKYEAAPRWDYHGLRYKEVEYLGQIDLALYAKSNYPSLKEGRKEVIKGMHCTWFKEPNGAQLSIGQKSDGKWTFVRRDRTASGSIFGFVAHMDGVSEAAAAQKLQDQYRVELEGVRGQAPSSSNFQKRQPERQLTFKEKLMEARAVVWPKEAFASIVARFQRMRSGVNEYLLSRGIDRETQEKFKGQIRTESTMSRVNPLGVAFPVRDADGVQTTFDRKGPKKAPQDERSFSAMAGDGREQGDPEKVGVKRLPMLGELQNPERIYITEQLIDTLSLYQLDKKAAQEGKAEQVPERVLLLATAGNPSDAALSDIAQIAERNPNTPIHLGMDDDAAGRSLGAVINDAVKIGRGDQAQTVERKLEPGFKDWNQQLMQHRTAEEIEANWSKAKSGSSGYLAKEGISIDTQHRFKDDIRLEGAEGIDGQNVRGVMIAMRDENGQQTGYMRYGVEREQTTAREFRRPHTAQENDLVRIGQQQNAQTILVGHSAIDVLKVYEQQGRPEGALLIAAEGGFNDRQKAAFAQIVKANPSATFHVIPDATVDYHENAQKSVDQTHVAMMEAITETNPYAKVQEAAAPAPQGHYWRELDEQMAAEAASRPEAPALDQQQPENAQQAPAQADDRGPEPKTQEQDEKPSQQDEKAAEMAAARQEAEAAQRAAEIAEKRAEVQQNRDNAPKQEDPEQGYSM